jgi:hypothetical protein
VVVGWLIAMFAIVAPGSAQADRGRVRAMTYNLFQGSELTEAISAKKARELQCDLPRGDAFGTEKRCPEDLAIEPVDSVIIPTDAVCQTAALSASLRSAADGMVGFR